MAKEAEQAPATVLGIFALWVTIIALSFIAYDTYTNDALAADDKLMTMQTLIAKNTEALDCARKDRVISAKTREVNNLQRLFELATDENERRSIAFQIAEIQRELNKAQQGYDAACL
jgi:hypothetical protein